MKIAVTGATGFIGNNLCRELLRQGHSVRALCHHYSDSINELTLEKIGGDVLDPVAMEAFVKGAEVVFHLAAKISIDGDKDGSIMRVNVEGTRNVVKACLASPDKPLLIHFSSIHALDAGGGDQVVDESMPLAGPDSFKYDQSKADAQRIVNAAAKEGLRAVIINPTGVIGPYDFGPSLPGKYFLDLQKGKIPVLVPGGYDFIDVRDVVKGSILAMEKGRVGEQYLLTGSWISAQDMAQTAAKAGGFKAPTMMIPLWIPRLCLPFVRLFSKMTGMEPVFTRESLEIITHGKNISSEKARKELGFESRDPREAITDFFAWIKESKRF